MTTPPRSLSIIIPFIDKGDGAFADLASHYDSLVRQCAPLFPLDIIIVDSSPFPIYGINKSLLTHSTITHLRPSHRRLLDNDKLNNIHAAIAAAKMPHVILVDDDVRPEKHALLALSQQIRHHCIVKCMIWFDNPNVYDLIDLAGIYVLNTISPDKQLYANVGFHASLLPYDEFCRKDILFDDLAIYRHCQWQAGKQRRHVDIPDKLAGYVGSPAMKVIGSQRRLACFLRQRMRWSYENLAYPLRFAFFLLYPPMIYFWQSQLSAFWAVNSIISLIICVLLCGFVGQQRYRAQQSPDWVFMLSPVWLVICIFTTWLALWYVITGCPFAGARYRTPCIFTRAQHWFSW